MENRKQILTIVGGGAAGLAAAVSAARILPGKEIVVIEKNPALGRKLMATGNGKCNFSNRDCAPSHYNQASADLVKRVFKQMSPEHTLLFFEELGVFAREDQEGRRYPYSEQAVAVRDAFLAELAFRGVVCVVEVGLQRAEKTKDGFSLCLQNGTRMQTEKLILATGGKAGSVYGCDGSGYQLAKAFGHQVISPQPALVRMTSEAPGLRDLKGVRAKGCVTLLVEEKPVAAEVGEIQFTEDGISGICVFDLSRAYCQSTKKNCSVRIDLFPDYHLEDLAEKLRVRKDYLAARPAGDFLEGILNKKILPISIRRWGVNPTLPLSAVSLAEIKKLAELLKDWRIPISGTKGWADAQVTAGGVCLTEIEEETLESRLVKGLHFAGEIVDVDGTCGGRNLQWAFSSGFIAGRSAVMDVLR